MPDHEAAGADAAGHPHAEPEPTQAVYWTTTSTITEREPTATGTRVVESRHAENGVKPASNFLINMLFGGVPSFEDELVKA